MVGTITFRAKRSLYPHAVGMQYTVGVAKRSLYLHTVDAVGAQYAVDVSAKRSIPTVEIGCFYSYFRMSWNIEAFSLCVLLLPNLRVVPHGMKGTSTRFVTRPVYLRSQFRNNTNTVLL